MTTERLLIRKNLNGLRITEIETDHEKPSFYRFTLSDGGFFTVGKEEIFDEDGMHFEDDTE